MMTPEKTIARLSRYRRLLNDLKARGVESVFSHELATMASATAAQVRRDLMAVGSQGSPQRGYNVASLLGAVEAFLDPAEPQEVALVGVGNLGRAVLAFFGGRRPKLTITAAFDADEAVVGRVIHGCRVFPANAVHEVLRDRGIDLGVIAVPGTAAQSVAEELVRAGVRGVLNFAPVPLRVPESVYVEHIDMTTSLETVAYFARQRALG